MRAARASPLPAPPGASPRLVFGVLAGGTMSLALVSGAMADRVGLRACAVITLACAIGLAALGTDRASRMALLLLPFVGFLRRVTAGESGYVPSDPVIMFCLLLLLPAVALPISGGFTRTSRWIALLAAWLVLEALVSLTRGAVVSSAYSLLTTVVPVLLALQLALGRWPGLPSFTARWTPWVAAVTAVYSLMQWLHPPRWDMAWLATVQRDFLSVGLPYPGQFRIFGTMESPGAYAAFLGAAAVLLVARPLTGRHRPAQAVGRAVALGLIVVALSLTAVRSVLLPLPLAILVVMFLRGGRSRTIGLPAIVLATPLLVLLPPLLGNSDRAESRYDLGSLAQDESFNARAQLLRSFVTALANPIGTGLGSTGNAAAGTGGLSVVDNGYLARTIETGTVGLLLFLVAIAVVLLPALRGDASGPPLPLPWIGVVVFFLLYELSGPLIGATVGIYFWIGVGAIACHVHEHRAGPSSRPHPASTTGSGVHPAGQRPLR